MQYSTILGAALCLASTALGAPVVEKRQSISGTNAGSIFQFGDPAVARQEFYTVGSCGLSTYFVGVVPASMPLVAMPGSVMQNYGSAQHNSLCGKIVTMTRNGITRQAAVADTNISSDNSIDMTSDLWVAFGQNPNDGSIFQGLSWSIGGGGGSSGGSCKSYYTVQSGEYCYLIWTRFGISEAQLRAWNPSLDSACDLQIGQVLCVSE